MSDQPNPDDRSEQSKKPTWKAAALAFGPALTLVAVLFIAGVNFERDEEEPKSATRVYSLGREDGQPREFLYLDGARVDAYLSQFDGGLATLQKTSTSKSRTRGGEVAAAPSKLSRQVQAQDVFERSVTPTTTSRLISLVGYLKDFQALHKLPRLAAQEKSSPRVRERARTFLARWRRVRESNFVELTARVSVPRFGRLYQIVSQVPASSAAGRLGAALLRAVGPNPRLPVAINVDAGDGGRLRLVLPLQYSLLATESSLLVGRVTIIGKVLYRIHAKRRPYRDLQTWSRFRAATIRAITPDRLLRRLRLERRALRTELLGYRTVSGPAAVVLPIAIYK